MSDPESEPERERPNYWRSALLDIKDDIEKLIGARLTGLERIQHEMGDPAYHLKLSGVVTELNTLRDVFRGVESAIEDAWAEEKEVLFQ